jgi:hypothetical protein
MHFMFYWGHASFGFTLPKLFCLWILNRITYYAYVIMSDTFHASPELKQSTISSKERLGGTTMKSQAAKLNLGGTTMKSQADKLNLSEQSTRKEETNSGK